MKKVFERLQRLIARRKWSAAALVGLGFAGFAFLAGAIASAYLLRPDLVKQRIPFLAEAPPVLGDTRELVWTPVQTNLLTLEKAILPLGNIDGSATGGAIETFGDNLIYATASGMLAVVNFQTGDIAYQTLRVPMDYERLRNEVFVGHEAFNQNWYRVHDLLIRANGDGGHDLFVSHHEFMPEGDRMCTSVHRTPIELAGGVAMFPDEAWERVYTLDGCLELESIDWKFDGHMSGGRMVTFDDDHILMSTGDFGLADFHGRAAEVMADSGNALGKIIKINLNDGGYEPYAYGVRNPQGLAWDNQGRLWETEHLAMGGDEVNLIKEGVDYGWPHRSLGVGYNGDIPLNPVQGRHEGFQRPVYAFVPSIAISNLIQIDGEDGFELWNNDFLITSLGEKTLFRMRVTGERALLVEPIEIGERLRDIVKMENGVYAILSGDGSETGERVAILIRAADAADAQLVSDVSGFEAVEQLESETLSRIVGYDWGQDIYRGSCSGCHAIDDRILGGPSLGGIVSADIAGDENYTYSAALQGASGVWTRKKLERYILDPQSEFEGSVMPAVYLDEYELKALLDYLEGTERN